MVASEPIINLYGYVQASIFSLLNYISTWRYSNTYLSRNLCPTSSDASRDTICPTLSSVSMETRGSAPSSTECKGKRREESTSVSATSPGEPSLPDTRLSSNPRMRWVGSREVT